MIQFSRDSRKCYVRRDNNIIEIFNPVISIFKKKG